MLEADGERPRTPIPTESASTPSTLIGIPDNVRVGPDVHRRRTQVAALDEEGHELFNRNVPNDVEKLGDVLVGFEPGPRWCSRRPVAVVDSGAAARDGLRGAHGPPDRVPGDRLGPTEE